MSYTSQQVLKYIKKVHKKGFSLDHTVQNHAEWELENIPVADLKIASEEDPYNRVLDLDQDHVDTITKQDILAHAIVADENGHIIDGNHRAAKAQNLGMGHIPAFVPVIDPDNETYDQHMKRIKTNETTEPGDYVYHASFLPDPQQGLKSVLLQGLRPSETGYSGPGVYFAYDPDGGYYHVSKEEATMFRAKWTDLVNKFGKYPENPNGIERDDNEIIVPGAVPASMLEVEYFPGEWWDLKSAYEASKGPVMEAVIDNVNGAGAVPYNQDVDYFGLRVKMKPTTFLKLAAPLPGPHSAELEKYIADGGAIGAPFLDIAVPPEWDENDFSKSAQIKGHEGRNRMTAILKLEGDKPIETHLFVKYYRNRDLTPAFVENLNSGLYAEKSTHLIGGPLFTTGVSESLTEAFNQPYKLKWEKGDYGDVDAYAKMDDGNYLSIMFNKGVSQDSKEEAWSVEFFRNNSQEVTGEGDAQRVFATVLGAIQTFIKKYKPNRIIFSASKEVEPGQNAQSRARLYDSLVQRYARTWGFSSSRADAGNKVIYELSRIKPIPAPKAAEPEAVPEARTNPEQNPKPESGFKELAGIAKTISNPENWAISMTSEPKLGINPQVGVSEDTPKGIYFYPLNYALSKTRYGRLPWGDNYPYIQLFQYDRSGEMTKQTQVDSTKLKQALLQYCPEEVIQSAIDKPEYDETPYWFIYDCLSRLGKSDETNVVRWNKVLRDLGFTSVYDDGAGWIAYNEPTQGVVLDPRVIKQLKTIVNKKQSGVVTPAVIERAIFETMDMELASNRAWQAYDPDGSKLKEAAKDYAKKPEFKQYYGKPGTEEIFDKAEGMGRYGARQLSDIAYEWWKAQQAQKTESIVNEGGWASTETQNTVITPHVIEEAIGILNQFAEEFNAWQAEQGLDVEIKMGKPVGSGTYYQRDLKQDPSREYGDVDVACYIHSREGIGAAKRTSEYAEAVKQFTQHNPKYSTANGANVIMDTSAGPIQVDLIFTYNEHANWARALAPEYRVKGVISASLLSSLAEVLNMSFGLQGVQVKTRAGRPVSFRQSKDTELHTVSIDPENWAADMYTYYYQLANGHKPESVPGNLGKNGGLKDEQRLSDIVMTFKALGTDLQSAGLLGTGALDYITDTTEMMKQISQVYSKKLDAVINSSKFDKAETPAAVEKANKTKLMLAKYRNEITKLLLN